MTRTLWGRFWLTLVLGGAICSITVSAGAAAGGGGSAGSEGSSSGCPASNPPNEMKLAAGSPQSAPLGSAFVTSLQVTLANSDGCTVTGAAGKPVTFTAPSSGASGVFATSGSRAVTVGANAQGDAVASSFTANPLAGSYVVTAVSTYGSVSFSLTNTASGLPARLIAISPKARATVTRRYTKPLQVKVLDANGAAVTNASVSFTINAASGTNACGATQAAGASFSSGSAQASATTDASGIATSPPLVANADAGSFNVSATVSSSSSSSASSSSTSVAPVVFSLQNLVGKPHRLAAGVGSSQSASVLESFAIPLAATVSDAHANPVSGVWVVFVAPVRGASGSFVIRSHHHDRASNTARVRSDACGIAIAPRFTANRLAGGYAVRATLAHVRPTAFGLVNRGG